MTMLPVLLRPHLFRQVPRLLSARPLHTSPAALETFSIQDEADFRQRVLKSDKPVVVDFTATW